MLDAAVGLLGAQETRALSRVWALNALGAGARQGSCDRGMPLQVTKAASVSDGHLAEVGSQAARLEGPSTGARRQGLESSLLPAAAVWRCGQGGAAPQLRGVCVCVYVSVCECVSVCLCLCVCVCVK